MNVEMWPVERLRPYVNNPRKNDKAVKKVAESIQKLNCSRIVIAHRLSTIMNADRIIMLEDGRIIEEGDYQTLIDRNGRFAELVERQRLDSEGRA